MVISYLASLIPLAIIGAKSFYTVLVAILSKSFLIFMVGEFNGCLHCRQFIATYS